MSFHISQESPEGISIDDEEEESLHFDVHMCVMKL